MQLTLLAALLYCRCREITDTLVELLNSTPTTNVGKYLQKVRCPPTGKQPGRAEADREIDAQPSWIGHGPAPSWAPGRDRRGPSDQIRVIVEA
ncbi:hypothetical protein [Nocardia testacea]|uniref:hypothetical protein n=1 Tax=Nocardia testacea TaxID=248551 RepID=UPI0033F53C01